MPSENRLSIIGIGPGDRKRMTFQAVNAIKRSKFVVGYRPYLELISDLLDGKEVISSSMGKEVDRAKAAVGLVDEGSVALISSGDPNIYGMAGLGLEIASRSMSLERAEVIPGVTSFTAAACAAGIVFKKSVAVISLSDLLTPWSRIERRLKIAAELGMPIALYNPKSHRRDWQLGKALEIYGRDTTVLIAKSVGREGEEIIWTKAGDLLENEDLRDRIDMFTLVILCGKSISCGRAAHESKINIVGTGPGSSDMITLEARELLARSSKIFGPERYLQSIRGISGGEEVNHQGSCAEKMAMRSKEAKAANDRGDTSSILTGGDPSIFSSAWRVLEEAQDIGIHIASGVSAFSAVAARAGAPLVNDFVLISGPEDPIKTASIADAGFGIAIYNVQGCEVESILQEMDPDRPCILARDAARSNEEIMILSARDLKDARPSGFRFTLMIASENSYIKDGKIITRRGYEKRYNY